MKALGRNEQCWCESGKKYKNCHLNIQSLPSVKPYVVTQALSSLNRTKTCSVPDSLLHECSSKIIKAHTVSKSSSLKLISHEGHVLKLSVCSKNGAPPKLQAEEVGINNASTFTGFCSTHDKELFSPIENEPFRPIPLHCFLVTYRGVSKEIAVKKDVLPIFEIMKTLDKGKDLFQQIEIQAAAKMLIDVNNLSANDLNYIKVKLDKMLLSESYTELCYAVFTLESPPPIMGSAIAGPKFDFNGKKAQHISSIATDMPDYISINSFASDGKGYVVLSWLPEHSDTCKKLIDQFLSMKLTADTLGAFMIILIENFYMSPLWWQSLDNDTQKLITKLYSQGVDSHTDSASIILSRPLHFPSISNITMSYLL